MINTSSTPCLNCAPSLRDNTLLLNLNGEEYALRDLPFSAHEALELLNDFNGAMSIGDIAKGRSAVRIEQIQELAESLYEGGFLKELEKSDALTGLDCLLEVEDVQNRLMYKTLYENVFWKNCQTPEKVPLNVFYGMAIENYHFLFRESWFDAPILSFPGSIKTRVLMSEFFCEEYGHDELLLKSLETIGIRRDQIYRTVPLPETLALCNCLAHWAATDPLFFFTTLGVLEGKDLKIDSYVKAMESAPIVSDDFISPIRAHSNINLGDSHGNLGRQLFKHIDCVSRADVNRLKAKTHLFIEIYDRFYTAIWTHYSQTTNLLRVV